MASICRSVRRSADAARPHEHRPHECRTRRARRPRPIATNAIGTARRLQPRAAAARSSSRPPSRSTRAARLPRHAATRDPPHADDDDEPTATQMAMAEQAVRPRRPAAGRRHRTRRHGTVNTTIGTAPRRPRHAIRISTRRGRRQVREPNWLPIAIEHRERHDELCRRGEPHRVTDGARAVAAKRQRQQPAAAANSVDCQR